MFEYNQKTENQNTENQKTENQKTENHKTEIKRPKSKDRKSIDRNNTSMKICFNLIKKFRSFDFRSIDFGLLISVL